MIRKLWLRGALGKILGPEWMEKRGLKKEKRQGLTSTIPVMNVPQLLFVFVAVLLATCGGRREREQVVVEDSTEEAVAARRMLLEEQADSTGELRAAVQRKLIEAHAGGIRGRDSPDYRRRSTIEMYSINTQMLLVIPRDEISLTEVRTDGLLQRKVSLEVKAVFLGEQPSPVVQVYELVAPAQEFMINESRIKRFERQEFMSSERKARVVVLETCYEEDGQERLALYRSYVPSARQLRELAEDAKKYRPKRPVSSNPCIRGSVQVAERFLEIFEMDGTVTELK